MYSLLYSLSQKCVCVCVCVGGGGGGGGGGAWLPAPFPPVFPPMALNYIAIAMLAHAVQWTMECEKHVHN